MELPGTYQAVHGSKKSPQNPEPARKLKRAEREAPLRVTLGRKETRRIICWKRSCMHSSMVAMFASKRDQQNAIPHHARKVVEVVDAGAQLRGHIDCPEHSQ